MHISHKNKIIAFIAMLITISILFSQSVLYATEKQNSTSKINEEIFQQYLNKDINEIVSFLKRNVVIETLSEENKELFLKEQLNNFGKTKIVQIVQSDFAPFLEDMSVETYYTTEYTKNKYPEYINYLNNLDKIDKDTLTFYEYLLQDKNYSEWNTYLSAFRTDILELFLDTYVFNDKVQVVLKETIETKDTEKLDNIVIELQQIADTNGYAVQQLTASIVDYYGYIVNNGFESNYSGFDAYFFIEKENFIRMNNIYTLISKKNEYFSFKQLYKEFFMLSSFDIFKNTDIELIESYLASMSNYKLYYETNIESKVDFYNLLISRIKCYNKEIDEEQLLTSYNSFIEKSNRINDYYESVENAYGQYKEYPENKLVEYENNLNKRYSYLKQNTSLVEIEKTIIEDTNLYRSIPVLGEKNSIVIWVIVSIILVIAIFIVLFILKTKNRRENDEYYY